MSETAQFGPAGMEVHEASPPVVFEAFFEQEGDRLYRALWLVTRNQFEAEELTQEAFVLVLERWDRVSEMEAGVTLASRPSIQQTRRASFRGMDLPDPPRFEPPRPDLIDRSPQPPQAPTPIQGNGMAVAALVLGIVGCILGLVPLTGFIALICGILGLVFGFVGYNKAKTGLPHKTMAIWGVVLGAGAVILGIIGLTIVADVVNDIDQQLNSLPE
jgi:hypothetical protein